MSEYAQTIKHAGSIVRERNGKFQVETNRNRRRTRSTFNSLDEAMLYAEHMSTDIKNEGTAALSLTERQKQDAVLAFRILGGEEKQPVERYHTPLAEAARFWLKHHPQGQKPPSLTDLLLQYEEAKKYRRKATRDEIRNKVGRFVRTRGEQDIREITGAEIEDWLTANTETLATRRKYYYLLNAFFGYAVQRSYISENPVAKAYLDNGKMDEKLPEAYSVEEVTEIMRAATEEAERAVPMLAVGFFAGLRPSEVTALDWSDVDFTEKHIRVRPETAKRRRQRFVEMSDNLILWLTPYRKESGPLALSKMAFRRDRAKILKHTSLTRWIHDGLRHTFATAHFAYYQDAAKTACEMGHTGNTAVLHQHYRALMKKSNAKRYWQIRPAPQAQGVKQFPVRAAS